MDHELNVPQRVPVMTLTDVVLFPQAIMPLHIFEERYRLMLKGVLNGERLFAIAQTNQGPVNNFGLHEPPHDTATLGIVRACHDNPDGTSNLVLQGLCRVKINAIHQEVPYRIIDIAPLQSNPPLEPDRIPVMRTEIHKLLAEHDKLGRNLTDDFYSFINSIKDYETFIDLLGYSICEDPSIKQKMLETLDMQERYRLFIGYLRKANEKLLLRNKLQGSLSEDKLDSN